MKKRDAKKSKDRFISLETIILFSIFLGIALVFYILLNAVKGTGFGILEIIFSLVFAIFVAGLLIWTRNLTMTNAYLGTLSGVLIVVALGYAFYLRYRGKYSTIFMIITGLVILIYFGRNFFKYKGRDGYEEE